MNIMQKLTIRQLLKNKRRTLVTIIGVIISVAMITAVATLATSIIKTLQQAHIETHGEWHVTYENITDDDLQTLREDKYTRDIILTRDLGYAVLEKNNNLSKPYMFVKQYNDTGFTYMPIEIIEGRQPETDKELLVSEHMFHQAGIDLQIGDM